MHLFSEFFDSFGLFRTLSDLILPLILVRPALKLLCFRFMGGIGHGRQQSFFTDLLSESWRHQFSYGGSLRRKRAGRGCRPLSTKEPLHVVFKVRKAKLRRGSLRTPQEYNQVERIISKYAAKFFIKIERKSIQKDHIHLLIRTSRRSRFHHFFRVVAGQVAQRFEKEGLLKVTDTPGGLWLVRPFSRVVRGYRDFKTVVRYIQLNELEACGRIPYQKNRLRGLSTSDWLLLLGGC